MHKQHPSALSWEYKYEAITATTKQVISVVLLRLIQAVSHPSRTHQPTRTALDHYPPEEPVDNRLPHGVAREVERLPRPITARADAGAGKGGKKRNEWGGGGGPGM